MGIKTNKIISTKELVIIAIIFIAIVWVIRFSVNNPGSYLFGSPWWELGLLISLFILYFLIRFSVRAIKMLNQDQSSDAKNHMGRGHKHGRHGGRGWSSGSGESGPEQSDDFTGMN